ncbi:protein of unknown function [Burkholderia multivorans]
MNLRLGHLAGAAWQKASFLSVAQAQ